MASNRVLPLLNWDPCSSKYFYPPPSTENLSATTLLTCFICILIKLRLDYDQISNRSPIFRCGT